MYIYSVAKQRIVKTKKKLNSTQQNKKISKKIYNKLFTFAIILEIERERERGHTAATRSIIIIIIHKPN